MKTGKFITFDGRHCSGKTHIVNRLSDSLVNQGFKVFTTKEPTDTDIGKLAKKSENLLLSNTLVCLFAADRYEHCKQITEKLNDGYIVICDRYIISALVLQSMDGVDFDYILSVNKFVLQPDLSVVLHANNNVIKERNYYRGDSSRLALQEMQECRDRFKENLSFFKNIIKNVVCFENNTKDDQEKIVDFICQGINEL